jgi:hypothetical protein
VNDGQAKNISRRRLRWLWIGLVTWSLISINAIRYVQSAPYQALLIGGGFDLIMVGVFIIAIRRAYRDIVKEQRLKG